MTRCFICNKGSVKGHIVSHSNMKTKRLFKPNLHRLSVQVVATGELAKMCMCAKCFKKIKNDFWEEKPLHIVPVTLINQKKFKTSDKKVIVSASA